MGAANAQGRDDITLWVSADGTGTGTWAEYSLTAAHNRLAADPATKYTAHVNDTDLATKETSSYTSLLRVGATTALVLYDKRAGPSIAPGQGGTYAMRISFE